MSDVFVMNVPLPVITLEDVFKAQGADYSKRPPRQSTLELHQRILLESPQWLNPKAYWREVTIQSVTGSTMTLEKGETLTSAVLTKVAGSADKLVIFAVTIGEGIEECLAQYRDNGKLSDSFAMDATGTAYLTEIIQGFVEYLEERYRAQGLKTTFPLGPGHSYWKGLDDLQVIFNYLACDGFDLKLNSSNLIIPRKSVGLVMAVGQDIPDTQGKTHCNFCHLQSTCALSTATHDKLG